MKTPIARAAVSLPRGPLRVLAMTAPHGFSLLPGRPWKWARVFVFHARFRGAQAADVRPVLFSLN